MLKRTVLSKSIHLRRYSQSAAAAIFHDAEGDVFPRPDPKYAETIVAIPRLTSGKSIAAKERKVGRVPSIIFEQEDGQHGGNKRLISVQANQIRKLVNHLGRSFFLSRLFDLEVRADILDPKDIVEKVRVLPRLVLSFFSFFLSFLCLLRAVFGSRESLGKWEKFRKFARLFSGISPF
jgi:large subunit ribosomal protein L25